MKIIATAALLAGISLVISVSVSAAQTCTPPSSEKIIKAMQPAYLDPAKPTQVIQTPKNCTGTGELVIQYGNQVVSLYMRHTDDGRWMIVAPPNPFAPPPPVVYVQ